MSRIADPPDAIPTAPGFDRITHNPDKMNGQPAIRGIRLTVGRVLESLAIYPDRDELKRQYPGLEDEDIRQALLYAAAILHQRDADEQ